MAPREGQAGTSEILSSTADAVFGTRSHTVGARLQLPRKVPLRIEPKSFFDSEAGEDRFYENSPPPSPANERTFLGWLSMATTVGGISTALAGYINGVQKQKGVQTISQRTSGLITLFMLPLAMIMILYAMLTFYYRSKYMRMKQVGFYQDWYGPAILATLIMAVLVAILILAVIDLAT